MARAFQGKSENPEREYNLDMSIRGSNMANAAALHDEFGNMERLPSHGRRAVPEKPTMEMLTAGSCAGGVPVEVAWNIYQAMLKAAP
jgi:hypothetical protein